MSETLKAALDVMTRLNPYKGTDAGDEETYDAIYDALHTLALAGVITKREWFVVVNHDRHLQQGR